jgi:hypothetical protein
MSWEVGLSETGFRLIPTFRAGSVYVEQSPSSQATNARFTLCFDYVGLQASENLNSEGWVTICVKQSCPQPSRIGHREHSLIRKQGSSKIA